MYIHIYIYIGICIYIYVYNPNLPRNVITRLPCTQSGDSQGQERWVRKS